MVTAQSGVGNRRMLYVASSLKPNGFVEWEKARLNNRVKRLYHDFFSRTSPLMSMRRYQSGKPNRSRKTRR